MSADPIFESQKDPFAQEDPFDQRQPTWFPERDTYAPREYDPRIHAANPLVTQNGVPIPVPGPDGASGFKVHEVAPERRWAVQESGEVLAQPDFEREIRRWQAGYYSLPRPHKPGFQPSPMTGSLNDEPLPRVERFVAVRVDPGDPSRVVPIQRQPTERPRLTRQWDQRSEQFVPVDTEDEKTRQIAARHGYEMPESKPAEEAPTEEETAPKDEAPALSTREHRILEMRREGKTHRQIAGELDISTPYVSKLIAKIKKKQEAALG